MTDFSDYVIYVDGSGDHGLKNIDPEYPIFVLAFCIFKKSDYLNAVKDFQEFKFKYFGHDMVILHENDIRRNKGIFQFLHSPEIKQTFIDDLDAIVNKHPFAIIATVIDKNELTNKLPRCKQTGY